jgi:predicted HAD superfamily hydrolase
MNEYNLYCQNSILEKRYTKFLQNKEIKVVSFDIFETLAFRKVTNPSDIFFLVGNNDYVQNIFDCADTFRQLRIEAEKLARVKYSNKEEITLDLIYEQLSLSEKEKETIIELEIQEEFKNIYINKQIENWIEQAFNMDKKVIFISDMYLLKEHLNKIVFSKLKNKELVNNLFVSNSYNATKATGNLFKIVLEELNLNAIDIFHIGDNLHSDITMANQNGISSLHYSHRFNNMYDLEYKYISSGIKNGNNFRIMSSFLNPFEEKEKEFFFNLGSSIFGPILWGFSNWINSLAKKNDVNQINCVMREGRVFEKYISKINSTLETNLIFASRKSTFLPSINVEDLKQNGFNFYNYRKFTIANFYNLFKLKINNKYISENKDLLIKDANSKRIYNQNLLQLISDDFNMRFDEVKINIENEKDLFLSYLNQMNFTKDSILIDFGGTGSILKNIKKVLGTKISNNVLFYMHETGFNNMLEDKIFTFFPFNKNTQKNIEIIRRSPEFIEILFNGINRTTLNYMRDENEQVLPLTDFPYKKIEQTKEFIDAFDSGIDVFFSLAKEYKIQEDIFSREELLYILTRLIEVPTKDEANYLGSLFHDEGYGSLIVEKLIEKEHLDLIKEIGIEKAYFNFNSNLSYNIGKIPWVQGSITLIDSEYIKKFKALETKSVNYDAIRNILNALEEQKDIKNIWVYGAGQFFSELLPDIKNKVYKIKGVIDTRAKFSNFKSENFDVLSLDQASIENGDTIVISSVVFAIEITDTILEYLKNKNISIKIVNHYNGVLTF